MKKLIAILCTLVCILGLTACGEREADLAKKKERESLEQRKIELIEQYAFAEIVDLVDRFTQDESYYALSVYNNEELEYLFDDESQAFFVDGHGLSSVIESFRLAKETTGTLRQSEDGRIVIGEVKARINGNQIVANADVEGQKKSANIELIFSNDIFLKLEGGALNPKASFGEMMEKAGLNTLIGMGTVFAVLVLISLIIACFGVIPKIQAAFAKKEKEEVAAPAPQVVLQAEEVEEEDDTELVAVIAAAIAAFEGSANTDGFVVRSIRRR